MPEKKNLEATVREVTGPEVTGLEATVRDRRGLEATIQEETGPDQTGQEQTSRLQTWTPGKGPHPVQQWEQPSARGLQEESTCWLEVMPQSPGQWGLRKRTTVTMANKPLSPL